MLVACESTPRGAAAPAESGAPQSMADERTRIAGGETSEFSGGDVAYGYCPRVTSRTNLDFARADVAKLVALAQGQHEIPLRWRREFPDERIRGFEERTTLLLDVRVIVVEDVVCESAPDDTGYETSGYRARLRRLELAVEFSTADGAVRGSFQQPFVTSETLSGELYAGGRARFPINELEGTLDLGVEPALMPESETLGIDILFAEQSVQGSLSGWVSMRGFAGAPSWIPVTGTFPAPGEGCETGAAVPLDEPLDVLGDTPRAAYDLARERVPMQPLRAAWQEPWQNPGALTWTELSVSPGAPTHACLSGQALDVYAPLRLESADGRVRMEPVVVTRVGLQPAAAGQPRTLHDFSMSELGHWVARSEFEASAGLRDLDLGSEAEYGALQLQQTFDIDADRLGGGLFVRKWGVRDAYSPVYPELSWCAGACEAYWCSLTATGDAASCP